MRSVLFADANLRTRASEDQPKIPSTTELVTEKETKADKRKSGSKISSAIHLDDVHGSEPASKHS